MVGRTAVIMAGSLRHSRPDGAAGGQRQAHVVSPLRCRSRDLNSFVSCLVRSTPCPINDLCQNPLSRCASRLDKRLSSLLSIDLVAFAVRRCADNKAALTPLDSPLDHRRSMLKFETILLLREIRNYVNVLGKPLEPLTDDDRDETDEVHNQVECAVAPTKQPPRPRTVTEAATAKDIEDDLLMSDDEDNGDFVGVETPRSPQVPSESTTAAANARTKEQPTVDDRSVDRVVERAGRRRQSSESLRPKSPEPVAVVDQPKSPHPHADDSPVVDHREVIAAKESSLAPSPEPASTADQPFSMPSLAALFTAQPRAQKAKITTTTVEAATDSETDDAVCKMLDAGRKRRPTNNKPTNHKVQVTPNALRILNQVVPKRKRKSGKPGIEAANDVIAISAKHCKKESDDGTLALMEKPVEPRRTITRMALSKSKSQLLTINHSLAESMRAYRDVLKPALDAREEEADLRDVMDLVDQVSKQMKTIKSKLQRTKKAISKRSERASKRARKASAKTEAFEDAPCSTAPSIAPQSLVDNAYIGPVYAVCIPASCASSPDQISSDGQ